MTIKVVDKSELTRWQRIAYRRMLKVAGKRREGTLSEEDWEAYYRLGTHRSTRAIYRVLRSLPSTPRCRMCGAPFHGFGGSLVRPLGYRPSRKNPHLCATCVELAPPGGMTMDIGVLFADVRDYTAMSERVSPQELSALLRRFYSVAEGILFEHSLIDKLIGDEVMALYIPLFVRTDDDPAEQMLTDARALLDGVGDFLDVGVGLDYGQAFVGNIGDRALYDFTAVGDVVNTAARLTGEARAGEIVYSARLGERLQHAPGEPVELTVKGKARPVSAYRLN